jgi:Family of unknown function (DUF6521)
MRVWNQRPVEIRNLFNPAFCGLVLFRATVAFDEEDSRGLPFSLMPLILPICLHKQSREIFATNPRGYFLKLVASHPQLLVGFGKRAQEMLPFTLEALGMLHYLSAIEVQPNGRLKANVKSVRKTITGSLETQEIQKVAKYLGKAFGRIGDRVTIYATMGVRP